MPGKQTRSNRRSSRGTRKRKPAKKKATLTVGQKSALKKMINEDIHVIQAHRDMVALSTDMTSIQPVGTYAGCFFKCNGTVVNNIQERVGESIKALNMDLRINLRFFSKHEQYVRLVLIKFDNRVGATHDQVLDAVNGDNTQPMNVIRSFYKRNPTIKAKVLKDIVVKSAPTGLGSETGLQSRNKYVRIFHKFKDDESQMTFASKDGNLEPQTNAIFLFAVYGTGRRTDGTAFSDNPQPAISYHCRERYMK